jgi:hypothetical protein
MTGGSVQLVGSLKLTVAPENVAWWKLTSPPEITKRRVWDSNPRGSSRPLAVFKTAAIGH